MTAFKISDAILNEMVEWASRDLPYETCGLVFRDYATGMLTIRSIANVVPSPNEAMRAFKMHPPAVLSTFQEMERKGQEFVGSFHSHPTQRPIPSETDKRELPQVAKFHVIIGRTYDSTELEENDRDWVVRAWAGDFSSYLAQTVIRARGRGLRFEA